LLSIHFYRSKKPFFDREKKWEKLKNLKLLSYLLHYKSIFLNENWNFERSDMQIRFRGIVNINDGQYFSAMEICILSKQKQSSGENC
jgi:hypothetical protein